MRTVVGLYDQFEEAQQAAQSLVNAGFDRESISVVMRDSHGEYARHIPGGPVGDDMQKTDTIAGGAAAGAGIGAAMGGLAGLLVGLGALAIPGIGPVIAAGPLAAALAGAGIGAAAGGLLGALTGLGIPEEHAQVYMEGVKRGGTLVLASVQDDMADPAVDILNRYNPVNIEERRRSWTDTNWDAYDQSTDTNQKTAFDEGAETGIQTDAERKMNQQSVPVTGSVVDDVDDADDVEALGSDTQRGHVPGIDDNLPVTGGGMTGNREQDDDDNIPVTGRESTVFPEIDEETWTDELGSDDIDDDWPRYESLFRQDFQSRYASLGQNFGYYQPAYRFGYDLGSDSHYTNYDWTRLEPEARMEWERRGAQTAWEDIKDAVRHGWEAIRR
jgi:hypothetical protein